MADYIIGPTTKAAMEDARARKTESFDRVDELMSDLNDDDSCSTEENALPKDRDAEEPSKPALTAEHFGASIVSALSSLGRHKQ